MIYCQFRKVYLAKINSNLSAAEKFFQLSALLFSFAKSRMFPISTLMMMMKNNWEMQSPVNYLENGNCKLKSLVAQQMKGSR